VRRLISRLAGVARAVTYGVCSLCLLLAKRDLTSLHFAKSSSTMPGIFLTTNIFAHVGGFFVSISVRMITDDYGW
jgi:hypothetical protein